MSLWQMRFLRIGLTGDASRTINHAQEYIYLCENACRKNEIHCFGNIVKKANLWIFEK